MRQIITALRIFLMILSNAIMSTSGLLYLPFDKKGTYYFWIGSHWSMLSLWLCRIKVDAKGKEHIPSNGNYIIVSNHASFFDIPAIMSIFPQARIMFKKELSYIPLWGWALKWGYHIMVDRGRSTEAMKSLERAIGDIKAGGSVLLFAEGTRSRDGRLQPFKRGAFQMAARTGVPILPVILNGTYAIQPKGSFDIRPRTIEMIIGEPVETAGITTREGEIALMKKVEGLFQEHFRFIEA
ncbi:MAG TPA: lysophospholipid acyltransferase family protein [Bacteroidota bacterium]|nr:lysophospholipid acyltransferase family protein [Bacteroidota bacterium]